jgi:phosphoribosylanthranilate isomerase
MTRVKVCGVTSVADARMCAEAGVDAIGLNFWPKSVRRCDEDTARAIVAALPKSVLVVGVFVDASLDEVVRIRDGVGLGCVQLHGDEPPAVLAALLPHAYKALRVKGPDALLEMARFPGEYLLFDAYVKGMPGGTGETFDWDIAEQAARQRKLTLAGGLTPTNVAAAVRAVRPYCVDTASGVESVPGVKSPELVRAFVREARSALSPAH